MELPNMRYADKISKSKQIRFRGLNHTLGAGDGDIWDMRNMTSDHTPVLSSRPRRWLYRKLENPGGIFSLKGLCWVDGESFFYKGEKKGTVTPGKKSFCAVREYIIILPDKVCYNLQTDSFHSMESRWAGESLTFGNGLLYEEEADANCISCEGVSWSEWFREGDAVTISGCTEFPENNQTSIIRQIDGDKLYFYENIFKLKENAQYTETGEMKLERTVPDVQDMFENENRLWGRSGSTIYASKPNDIYNWNVYDGLDSDAWAVTAGAAGDLTGSIAYRGYPIFFQEERIYKVYGSLPSEFDILGSASLGIPPGCGDSLAIAGETLFYLGRNGIMAYTGGIPQLISRNLGNGRFNSGVAGSDGMKYYISMADEDGSWGLYVYDTQRGVWHREDDSRITHFTKCDGNLYGLNDRGEIWIYSTGGTVPEGCTQEDPVEWMTEFADFTDSSPNKKGIGKVQVRLELEDKATAQVEIQFDSDGVWQNVGMKMGGGAKRSYYLPIVPRRCDHCRIRISGVGGFQLYSMVRELYTGSELKSTYGRN